MKFDPIALAIPVFFLLIGFEVSRMRKRGLSLYRFADAVTDLSCGIGSEIVRMGLGLVGIAAYAWVYNHWRLVDLAPYPAAAWAVGFIGVDFFYYWFHRLSHEINFLWALHVVHHQSEDYNLAVALRQSWFQGFAGVALYLPLALLGVPPLIWIGSTSISLLYQFWIHTQLIRNMGAFEYVFNTPSHHRVHHGRNPQYIDRNHGGIFIIWDRLFGTFEPEGEEVVYGLVKPIESWNPVWANFHHWREMFQKAKTMPRWSDKIQCFLRDPAWRPASLGGPNVAPPVKASEYEKWEPRFANALKPYVNFQFVLTAAGTTAILFFQHQLPWQALVAGGGAIVLTTVVWGALFEGKSWARTAEWLRHGLLLAGTIYVLGVVKPLPAALAGAVAVLLASAVWFGKLGKAEA